MPHGASQDVVPTSRGASSVSSTWPPTSAGGPGSYRTWYGAEHARPDLLGGVPGLPELFRADIAGASRVAAPGCYVTTAVLPGAPPAVRARGVVRDRGGRRQWRVGRRPVPKPATAFCAVDEDFYPYGLLTHRHTPEIEQGLSRVAPREPARVLFTPHLAPMNRGILATCYARPSASGTTTADAMGVRATWSNEPFVVVTDRRRRPRPRWGRTPSMSRPWPILGRAGWSPSPHWTT